MKYSLLYIYIQLYQMNLIDMGLNSNMSEDGSYKSDIILITVEELPILCRRLSIMIRLDLIILEAQLCMLLAISLNIIIIHWTQIHTTIFSREYSIECSGLCASSHLIHHFYGAHIWLYKTCLIQFCLSKWITILNKTFILSTSQRVCKTSAWLIACPFEITTISASLSGYLFPLTPVWPGKK
jgi:hypothetical protein